MRLDSDEMILLHEIVERRRADLIAIVSKIGDQPLATEVREELRRVLADELDESGRGRDGELNAHGLYVDSLIERLSFT